MSWDRQGFEMLALGGSSPRHRNRSCEQEKRKLVTWFRVWGFGWFRLAHSRTAGISCGLGLGIPAGDLSMLLVVRVFTSSDGFRPFPNDAGAPHCEYRALDQVLSNLGTLRGGNTQYCFRPLQYSLLYTVVQLLSSENLGLPGLRNPGIYK